MSKHNCQKILGMLSFWCPTNQTREVHSDKVQFMFPILLPISTCRIKSNYWTSLLILKVNLIVIWSYKFASRWFDSDQGSKASPILAQNVYYSTATSFGPFVRRDLTWHNLQITLWSFIYLIRSILLYLFQIIRRFSFSKYIPFVMHLDIKLYLGD
jgi:hypothetical protein